MKEKGTIILLSERENHLVKIQAAIEGITVAEYCRQAVLIRLQSQGVSK